MSWITPKTDWKATDKFNTTDYNRIANNLAYLRDYAKYKWYNVDYEDISEISFSTTPLAKLINVLETDLETLNKNTYGLNIGTTKTYTGNQRPINYTELNRIESATLKIYMELNAETTNVLSFTFGQMQFPTTHKKG